MVVRQFYKELCNAAGRELPFEVVEFNASPGELQHSSLFGIEKNTASGVDRHPGRITLADGGLIHFDEPGKASPKDRDQILTWMERGHFHQPGNEKRQTRRAIAVFTMCEDPFQLVRGKIWGIDFLNRFRNIIHVPALAENIDYILQLANTFAKLFLKIHTNGNYSRIVFSKELQDRIKCYNWLGNIRELENTVERWVEEAIIAMESTPQSTLILREDLFEKYPPLLSPLEGVTSEKESLDAPPRSLRECKDRISSYALEVFNEANPYLSVKEWDSARGHIKRHEKNLNSSPSDCSIRLWMNPSAEFSF